MELITQEQSRNYQPLVIRDLSTICNNSQLAIKNGIKLLLNHKNIPIIKLKKKNRKGEEEIILRMAI